MKFTITKLGRIEHAEIELKPLTVFVGKNGTNKTWVGYAMHALLKSVQRGVLSSDSPIRAQPDDVIAEKIAQAMSEAAGSDLQLDLRLARADDFVSLEGPEVAEWLRAPAASVGAAKIVLIDDGNEFRLPAIKLGVSADRRRASLVASYPMEWREGRAMRLPFAAKSLSDADGALSPERISAFVVEWAHRYFENIVFFPAERNGLVALADRPPSEHSLQVLPGSAADFCAFLAASRGQRDIGRSEAVDGGRQAYQRIVEGDLVFGGGTEPLIRYRRWSGPTFAIQLAPSFVRSFAALELYVRRWAQSGDFIVIDELELNAHPEAQLALVEYVACLANAGVRVVFTTHSPYMTDHLSNLMRASRANGHADELAPKFALGTKDAFIKPEDVAVYRFAESEDKTRVEVTDALDREEGFVKASTFAETSNRLGSLYDLARDAEETGNANHGK